MSITAKSVIFDIADGFGGLEIGVRQINFFLNGSLKYITVADFSASASSEYDANHSAGNAFDTALSLTGSSSDSSFLSNQATNLRLIIVFNDMLEFDEIRVSNYHDSGSSTDAGLKNVKVTVSMDSITDTSYGAVVSNSLFLNNTTWREHTVSDTADWQVIWVEGGVKSVVFDIADNYGAADIKIERSISS